MAPLGRSQPGSLNPEQTNESDCDIWSSILQQVQHSSTNKLPSDKAILILGMILHIFLGIFFIFSYIYLFLLCLSFSTGDNDSGKTSLIARMQGSNNTSKGSGLEYQYMIVRDEYRDEQTQCGIWILDGNYDRKQHLMIWALDKDTFKDTTIVLMCSMTKPWNIINSLNYWSQILEEHIKIMGIDPGYLSKQKNNCEFLNIFHEFSSIFPLSMMIYTDLLRTRTSNLVLITKFLVPTEAFLIVYLS